VIGLRLSGNQNESDDAARLAVGLEQLDFVEAGNLTSRGIAELGRLSRLKRLSISPISRDTLHAVARLKTVEQLDLSGRDIDPTALRYLAGLKNLRTLTLQSSRFGDEDLAGLSDLPRLDRLKFIGPLTTPRALIALGKLPRLTHLEVEGGIVEGKWNEDSGTSLGGLCRLKTLKMSFFGQNTGSVAWIRHLKLLEELHLVGAQSLTDVEMRAIGGFSNLRILNLATCGFTADGLAHLDNLPRLESFWLNQFDIDDRSIPVLQKMTSLRVLTLYGTQVTRAGRIALRQSLPYVNLEPDINDGSYR
jgi:hypothetical protein